MTNEDAIDLYNRVKVGTLVIVLAPHRMMECLARAWRAPGIEHELNLSRSTG